MNRINDSINYNFAQRRAYEVLVKYSDGKLPINPFNIISKIKNIKLMTYSEFAKSLQNKQAELSIEEIKCQFESDRGFLKKKGKKYILAYNELDPPWVIKWTLFHELGHYFLDHLTENYSLLFCDGQRYAEIKEKEANYFAKHCSCPFPVIKKVIDLSGYSGPTDYLMYCLFNMGSKPTQYCSEHFDNHHKFYEENNHKDIINKFEKDIVEFVNEIYSLFGIDYRM